MGGGGGGGGGEKEMQEKPSLTHTVTHLHTPSTVYKNRKTQY